ncbi:MAG: tripartite tricarboxylate transporter substrate binding protein [bacterium]|nr:tripartite tricarboxylate transporter substrate binding protein [Betaproteobacteria bacterium]
MDSVLKKSAAFAIVGTCLAFPAAAQTAWPAKPIRLVVPVASGGPSDTAARALARGLSGVLGQPMAVENRPGANLGIGAQAVLAAAPDGHTLLFALGGNVGLPALSRAAPYRSLNEFAPVGTIGGPALCLFTAPSVPGRSVAELVAHARGLPQPLLWGSNQVAEDFVAWQLMQASGIALTRVGYKGIAQMMPDLVEGRVQVAFVPSATGSQHLASGRLKLLACNAAERLPALPDVPTFSETGVVAARTVPAHFVMAPPATPAAITERLSTDLRNVAASPAFLQDIERLHFVGSARTPAQTRDLVRELEVVWARFVRDTGATLD